MTLGLINVENLFYEGNFCDQARRGRLGIPTLRQLIHTAEQFAATGWADDGLVLCGTRDL